MCHCDNYKDSVNPFRKDLKPDNKHIRFETGPGQQMQIDFAEKTLVINGEV